ncbi:MAG: hypothetical protein PHQ86_07085 [Dehalococcoidales bacterium]|nr:hypothetical protein [Dehalococcoidales bacterium]
MFEEKFDVDEMLNELLGEGENATVEEDAKPEAKTPSEQVVSAEATVEKTIDTTNINLPAKVSNTLKQWVSIVEKDYEFLVERVKLFYSAIGGDISEEERWNRAILDLKSTFSVRKDSKPKAEVLDFEGIFYAVSSLRDFAKDVHDAAAKLVATHGPSGLMNDKGEYLDTREYFASGKKNSGFGKPIPEHNYQVQLFGIARQPDESEFRKCVLTLRGPQAAMLRVGDGDEQRVHLKLDTLCKFVAINKAMDPDNTTYTLNSSVNTYRTGFIPLDKPVDAEEELKKNFEFVPLNGLLNWAKKYEKNYNKIFVFDADIKFIDPKTYGSGSTRVTFEDVSLAPGEFGATAFIDKNIRFNATKNSRVRVFGRAKQNEYPKGSGIISPQVSVYRIKNLFDYNRSVSTEDEDVTFAEWEQ